MAHCVARLLFPWEIGVRIPALVIFFITDFILLMLGKITENAYINITNTGFAYGDVHDTFQKCVVNETVPDICSTSLLFCCSSMILA